MMNRCFQEEEELVDVLVRFFNRYKRDRLAGEIQTRMRRIRDAQSCECSIEEVRQFPLVRLDTGVSVGR